MGFEKIVRILSFGLVILIVIGQGCAAPLSSDDEFPTTDTATGDKNNDDKPLAFSPPSASIATSANVLLQVSGGISPYYYSLKSGTGALYQVPGQLGLISYQAPSNSTTAIIQVVDSGGTAITATVTVGTGVNASPSPSPSPSTISCTLDKVGQTYAPSMGGPYSNAMDDQGLTAGVWVMASDQNACASHCKTKGKGYCTFAPGYQQNCGWWATATLRSAGPGGTAFRSGQCL